MSSSAKGVEFSTKSSLCMRVCGCMCVSSVPQNTGLQVCQLSKHCTCKVGRVQ